MTTELKTTNLHDDDIVKGEEGLIFNPYNPLNVEITLNDVQSILTKYGLPPIVYNINLYKRAFVHRSYTKRPSFENMQQNITIVEQPPDCLSLKTKSNERLEFIGDGVLELVTKYLLYRRFPKENEGFMTEKKIAIVKNEAIGKIALEMNINKWLILSKHAEEKKIRTNLKKLGCLFEAFLGALFLDFNKISVNDEEGWFSNIFVTGPGFQMAQKFVENIFEKHIDWITLIKNDDNYKNILQVRIQKEFKVTPHYLEMEHDPELGYKMGVFLCLGQPVHDLKYSDAVHIDTLKTFQGIQEYILENNGKIFLFLGQGQHKIKRKAEQEACSEALKSLDMHMGINNNSNKNYDEDNSIYSMSPSSENTSIRSYTKCNTINRTITKSETSSDNMQKKSIRQSILNDDGDTPESVSSEECYNKFKNMNDTTIIYTPLKNKKSIKQSILDGDADTPESVSSNECYNNYVNKFIKKNKIYI